MRSHRVCQLTLLEVLLDTDWFSAVSLMPSRARLLTDRTNCFVCQPDVEAVLVE